MSQILEGFTESGSITRRVIDNSLFFLSNAQASELVSAGRFLKVSLTLLLLMILAAAVREYVNNTASHNRLHGLLVLLRTALSLFTGYIGFVILRVISLWITRQGLVDGPWRYVSSVTLIAFMMWVLVALASVARYRLVNTRDLHWVAVQTKR